MAFSSVDSRYNGPALEQDILAFWREQDIFNKSIEKSKDGPRFSFCEGPPTANGKPGIHHVLARSFKDIYPRYKTMQGFYAPRKGGWDTHGLPVEHEIEKKLNIFDKAAIEKEVGIAEFTRLCRESVMTYIADWEKMTERMGYWVNLDEAYYTLDNQYIESVWNLLQRIWQKGLIYQGYKVVPYDPRIGATLSSHEVAQGYQTVTDPSITVRFPLLDEENTSILVWTTTPWTLPSNLLLAVGEDIDYCYVQHQQEVCIVAQALLENVFGEQPYDIIKTVKGHDLLGKRYQRLFDYLPIDDEAACFRVVSADFVSVEDGTGIVHTAPAYGVDDLALGQREGVPVVHGVGLDGNFKAEVTPVAGLFFKDADPVLRGLLNERGLLFKDEEMEHNYPFGWRTGEPLIYYAKNAWYIRTTEIKDSMVQHNKEINWVPETIKQGRFGNWLENNIDWALSRERFWGTPLPVWTDGDGDFMCIGSLQELSELVGRDLSELDLHRPAVDDIVFEKDGREYRRVPEVIDCWFDSGAMSYAQWHYPFENKEHFEAHFPADYICEAIDQTRGWFYTLHAIASLVDDSVAYKNCVCLSHIVDDQGRKMSKSKGNILDPYSVFDNVGADALRWLFLARLSPESQKRVSKEIVAEVAASFINTLWNTYAFFILYARLDRVDFSEPLALEQRSEIDRWVLALAHRTIATVTERLDNYDAKGAGEAIETLIDQLSNWYVRRNRRRFWKSDDSNDKLAAYHTLYESLDIITRLIAPFMPFLSENIYANLVRSIKPEAPVSVHLAEWPEVNEAALNDELVYEMNVVQQVVGLGRSAREESRVRVRQPLSRLLLSLSDDGQRQAVLKHQDQVLEELNIKGVEMLSDEGDLLSYQVKPNFPRLGKRYGKLMPAIKQALAAADGSDLARRFTANEQVVLQISGEQIELSAEDVSVESMSAAGYASVQSDNMLVALDTSITEALRIEGLARELVRTVQDARKNADLDIADRIHLHISGSAGVLDALAQYADYIKSETLAVDLQEQALQEGYSEARELEDEQWQITLKKQVVA